MPVQASDEDILAAVRQWVQALAEEDYDKAYALTAAVQRYQAPSSQLWKPVSAPTCSPRGPATPKHFSRSSIPIGASCWFTAIVSSARWKMPKIWSRSVCCAPGGGWKRMRAGPP